MLTTAKTAWRFYWNIVGKSIIRKIFDGEMFIRSLLTTLSQFFDKIIPNSKIIVKGIRDPDDNF